MIVPRNSILRKKLMLRNVFLWQDSSASDKNFLPMTRKFFLWQEISSWDKKFILAIRNVLLWQEISALEKIFLSVTRNFLLWQLIIFSAQMFLSVTKKIISFMLCVVIGRIPSFDRKYGNTLKSNSHQNSENHCKNFVEAWRFCESLIISVNILRPALPLKCVFSWGGY